MPKTATSDLHDFFEVRARGGDPSFAIAYALLELAEAQKRSATEAERLVRAVERIADTLSETSK